VGHAEAPYFHWRLRIVPSVVTPGGFEIGGGLPINPSSPEGDTEALRSVELAS
jgi:UDPglucose--hexose-1-phosphate uridylyltransferase